MLRNLVGGGPRAAGPPRVAPRASSFHLIWDLPGPPAGPPPAERRLVEVSATLEVLVPPRVEALYFWALQVDLADGRGIWGGGHTGLQWNRRYPGGRAVNWGGYASPEQGGRVLSGSASSLPGFPDDPNTLAFSWQVARPYRFRVYSSDEFAGAWRAEVVDLVSGEARVIQGPASLPGPRLGSRLPGAAAGVVGGLRRLRRAFRHRPLERTTGCGRERGGTEPGDGPSELPGGGRGRLCEHHGGDRRAGSAADHRGGALGVSGERL